MDSDRTRVGIERVEELIDIVVEHTDGAPECRILSVAVHSLLISLVSLAKVARGHVSSTKQVPGEWIVRIRLERFRQDLYRNFGVVERCARAVIEPAQLLQDFGVSWVLGQNAFIRVPRCNKLRIDANVSDCVQWSRVRKPALLLH